MYRISFPLATEAIKTINWINEPDLQLSSGCYLRHSLLEQLTSESARVVSYAKGDVWLCRYLDARGPIGSKYLFDAGDLIERTRANSGYENCALEISKNRSSTMKLSSIVPENGLVLGHVNIPIYSGSPEEFQIPDQQENCLFRISGVDVNRTLKTVLEFSNLLTDKANRLVYFKVEDDGLLQTLRVLGPEPDGNNGAAFVESVCEDISSAVDIEFCIAGKHLKKIIDLSYSSEVVFAADNLEEPTRLTVSSDLGFIDIPIEDRYSARALTQEGYYLFNPSGERTYDRLATRTFSVETAIKCVEIQKPKSTATRRDLLLIGTDGDLVITKHSDPHQAEASNISYSPESIKDTVREWAPLIVNYDYLLEALKTVSKLYKSINESARTPDFVWAEVSLTQIHVAKVNRWALLIEPAPDANLPGGKFVIQALTPERCSDYVEAETE